MGRVSKYKKVKSSVDRYGTGFGFNDSYGKQKPKKRSLTAKAHLARKQKRTPRHQDEEGFNLPPSSRKDDFDLRDLRGSIKKDKRVSTKDLLLHDADTTTVVTSTVTMLSSHHQQPPQQPQQPHDVVAQESKQMVRELNLKTTKGGKLPPKQESLKRQEGESMNAFRKRVKEETRQIMKDTIKKQQRTTNNSTTTTEDGTASLSIKQQKKKEFLKHKKMKKKQKKSYDQDDDSQDDDEYYLQQRQKRQSGGSSHAANGGEEDPSPDSSSFITGERAVAAVRSGNALHDQVERPPVFAQLPRGAKPKQNNMYKKKKANQGSGGDRRMNDSQIQAEQNAMEKMRQKVQAQYAIMKQKRKKAGDFHL